ncbi:MAG: rane protein [Thermoleophilales bacterium]|jgi:membrane protein|nr:rane protein [Thermoleophilales bacterium]
MSGAPNDPTDLEGRDWKRTLKRTVKEFQDDNLTDWAAALTYYAILALFPALLVLTALLGLFGQQGTIDTFIQSLRDAGLGSAADNIQGPLNGVVKAKGGAGALFGFGLLGAIWAASGYLGAFIRASNAIYEVEEGRPFWKLRPLQVALTVVGIVVLAFVLIGIVVSGPVAEAIGRTIGLSNESVTIYSIAKWPILIGVVMLLFAGLYYAAPNVKQPKFRWISPGGILAVLLWIVASAGFGFYVSHFGSYNKTYGTLGGVITFLVWMWITNIAVLLGLEFDAELERERELKAGINAKDEIKLPPRDKAGMKG